ncbi:hypothetical protein EIP86_004207 [Pleurotus ostreatoroseus]|nr:hypothetical protein EIP86_004207 [Pleurotus ostreatoroseus]
MSHTPSAVTDPQAAAPGSTKQTKAHPTNTSPSSPKATPSDVDETRSTSISSPITNEPAFTGADTVLTSVKIVSTKFIKQDTQDEVVESVGFGIRSLRFPILLTLLLATVTQPPKYLNREPMMTISLQISSQCGYPDSLVVAQPYRPVHFYCRGWTPRGRFTPTMPSPRPPPPAGRPNVTSASKPGPPPPPPGPKK